MLDSEATARHPQQFTRASRDLRELQLALDRSNKGGGILLPKGLLHRASATV